MNVDLESTLFYTMSTIAQTLSGSMGLLGAIVLAAIWFVRRRLTGVRTSRATEPE